MLGVSSNYIYMLERGMKQPSTQLTLALERIVTDSDRTTSDRPNLVRESEPIDLTQPSPLKYASEAELKRMHAAAAEADDWASVAVIGLELQSRKKNQGYPK